jgi:hypothetical protein
VLNHKSGKNNISKYFRTAEALRSNPSEMVQEVAKSQLLDLHYVWSYRLIQFVQIINQIGFPSQDAEMYE